MTASDQMRLRFWVTRISARKAIQAAGRESPQRTRLGHFQFSLRAHAAKKSLHLIGPGCRAAAEIAAIYSWRSENPEGKDQVAGRNCHSILINQ